MQKDQQGKTLSDNDKLFYQAVAQERLRRIQKHSQMLPKYQQKRESQLNSQKCSKRNSSHQGKRYNKV